MALGGGTLIDSHDKNVKNCHPGGDEFCPILGFWGVDPNER